MSGKLIAALLGAALTLGCGSNGGGSAAAVDDGKTPEQVAADAKQADTSQLEQAKAEYEAAIASTTAEIEKLTKQIQDEGSAALDNLMGQADAEKSELEGDIASWQAEADKLTKQLKNLEAKLKAVTAELTSRAAGGGNG